LNTHLRDNLNMTAPAVMSAQGDIVIASGANTPIRLAKSTTSTQYLANTGTSNAPAWNEVALDTGISGVLPIANGGVGVALSAPGADRILFWDHSATAYAYLTASTNLTISGTTITADAPTQATQSALEAETNENTYAPPDLIKHSPGVAKGWAEVSISGGTPSLDSSYNVSGINDAGVGLLDVTWDTDFSSDNYAAVALSSTTHCNDRDPAAGGRQGTVYISTADNGHNATDSSAISVVAFGELV
jgi:hypothetical protein